MFNTSEHNITVKFDTSSCTEFPNQVLYEDYYFDLELTYTNDISVIELPNTDRVLDGNILYSNNALISKLYRNNKNRFL